jgi:crotonobetainyl-CoA:carnitine CoA-transferase CaiB-like acyl-CoA transferase
MTEAVLAGTRVLDLTGPEGWFCGLLLAGFGADVIKLEAPGGDPERRTATDPARLEWFAWNRGKRSITIDPASESDRALARGLAAQADFVLDSDTPSRAAMWGLDYEAVHPSNPSLVYVSISPFGRSGPFAGYVGSDLVAQAAGGHMYMDGPPGQPMRLSVESSYIQAGVQAAVGALIAHYHRQRTGFGQHVDLSLQEAIAYTLDEHPAAWDISRELHPGVGVGRLIAAGLQRRTVFRCKDGWICSLYYFGLIGDTIDEAFELYRSAGVAVDDLDTPEWRKKLGDFMPLRMAEQDEARLEQAASDLAARYTRAELVALCDHYGFWAGEVYSPKELLANDHLLARGFWLPAELPGHGQVNLPGPPFILSQTPWQTPASVPCAGADNALLAPAGGTKASFKRPPEPVAGQVFKGIRIAEFAWVGVGPIAGKYFADQGAEVIRIESSKHPDILRVTPPFASDEPDIDTAGYYANFNSSKLGAALNFQHPRARELALALIAKSDVVTESYRPGVMERWGLRYEDIKDARPDLIWMRMPLFGLSGPRYTGAGYGNTLQAITGIYHLLGEPGGEPLGANTAFTDFFVTHFAALALGAALEHRRKTGRGQHIEVAQIEAAMYMLVPQLLEAQVTGIDPGPNGNHHAAASPHNAYPALGAGRHVVIACFTQDQWKALVEEMGTPAWAASFATLAERKANEAELNRLVGEWTAGRLAEETMHRLQARGVPAAVVATIEDLHKDPQLSWRRHYRYLDHPRMGRRAYEAPGFRLSLTPEHLSRPGPLLGQHNDYVWRELVGIPEEDLAQLIVEGAFE